MNNDLVWRFDVAVVEWLIILAILVILTVVGVVATRRSNYKALREANGQSYVLVSTFENWHAKNAKVALASFDTTTDGLSAEEATVRLAKYESNRIPEAKTRSSLVRFFYQFHNVLIYVLIAASAVTAMLGHWLDAFVILGVVLINAAIGFVQEGKAENALRAIRQMLSPNAVIKRYGRQITIQAEELVPGDIVLLQSGDKVLADLRLFRVKGLQVQEVALTGESVAVEKNIDPVEQATVIGDRHCMAYSGTFVSHGQGAGVVIATGAQTELGRISALVADVESLTTPLLRQMAQFGR